MYKRYSSKTGSISMFLTILKYSLSTIKKLSNSNFPNTQEEQVALLTGND